MSWIIQSVAYHYPMPMLSGFPDVVDEPPAHFLGIPHGREHSARPLNVETPRGTQQTPLTSQNDKWTDREGERAWTKGGEERGGALKGRFRGKHDKCTNYFSKKNYTNTSMTTAVCVSHADSSTEAIASADHSTSKQAKQCMQMSRGLLESKAN